MTFVGFAIFASLIGELGLRCFSTVGTRIFCEGRYQPGFSAAVYNPESGRSIPIRINREGFRDRDHEIAKSAGALRIAVLGDSFVADMAVEESSSLVHQLGQTLERSMGREVEMMNFGVSGCDLADYLQHYRHFARKYRPDLVVVCFFHGNDLRGRHPQLADTQTEHPYDEFRQEDIGGLKGWLLRNSVLYNWHCESIRSARDRVRDWLIASQPDLYYRSMKERFMRRWIDYRIFVDPPDPESIACWRVIESQLSALKREVESDGGRLFLVGIPSAEQASSEWWATFCKEGDKREGEGWSRLVPDCRLGEIAGRLGICYTPLLPDLWAAKDPCYFGRGHLNERGNRIAAQAIARTIQRSDERSHAN